VPHAALPFTDLRFCLRPPSMRSCHSAPFLPAVTVSAPFLPLLMRFCHRTVTVHLHKLPAAFCLFCYHFGCVLFFCWSCLPPALFCHLGTVSACLSSGVSWVTTSHRFHSGISATPVLPVLLCSAFCRYLSVLLPFPATCFYLFCSVLFWSDSVLWAASVSLPGYLPVEWVFCSAPAWRFPVSGCSGSWYLPAWVRSAWNSGSFLLFCSAVLLPVLPFWSGAHTLHLPFYRTPAALPPAFAVSSFCVTCFCTTSACRHRYAVSTMHSGNTTTILPAVLRHLRYRRFHTVSTVHHHHLRCRWSTPPASWVLFCSGPACSAPVFPACFLRAWSACTCWEC